jgi:TatA/E family protein of Tat protein translocase
MLNIGPQELILVLIIALVVVGPQKLPELGRAIGKALREFRKIQDDVRDSIKLDFDLDAEPTVVPNTAAKTTVAAEPDDDGPQEGPAAAQTTDPALPATDGDAGSQAAG